MFQIARHDETLRLLLCQSTRDTLRSDMTVVTDMFQTLATAAGEGSVVIDGLDEISDFEQRKLLEHLISVCKTSPQLRLLISSRSEEDIGRALKPVSESINVDDHNRAAIETYVAQWKHDWFQQRGFPKAVRDEFTKLIDPLPAKAEGNAQFRSWPLSIVNSIH